MNSEIERLAKEAGLRWLITTSDRDACYTATPGQIAKLVHLAAEECAKVAEDEDHQVDGRGYYDQLGDSKGTQKNIVAAIRAKFALSGLEDAAK